MNISHTIEEIRSICKRGNFDVFPLSMEVVGDCTTPIKLLKTLKKHSKKAYLLESVTKNNIWARYSFLGYRPKLEISLRNNLMQIGEKTIETNDPNAELRRILQDYKAPKLEELPPFTGGLVGYFSFDYYKYAENTVIRDVSDDYQFKDLELMLFDKVIAFDHYRNKIIIIINVSLKDLETSYNQAIEEFKEIRDLLVINEEVVDNGHIIGQWKSLFQKKEFCQMVEKAKKYIYEGDIFQVVLSNVLYADFKGSLVNAYRKLRSINPSPYMFYFCGTDIEIAGASPETLVKLVDDKLYTFPLAGTRPRGKNEQEDEALIKDLLSDEKEIAEHNMLVDLGRNDLGKICQFGTVKVDKLHTIEKFSHVMHIGSVVSGRIDDQYDGLDAISAVLPAGTLSGAPKIRACQIISELEGDKRGLYGGAIGYLDFSGNMQTCIGIRIIFKKNGTVFVRSGAGIVYDSKPEKEYQECINKAKSSVKALEDLEEFEK